MSLVEMFLAAAALELIATWPPSIRWNVELQIAAAKVARLRGAA